MQGITKRQHEVLGFIKGFIGSNGFSPSFEEIAIGVGLSSLASVYSILVRLKARGYIDWEKHSSRSIRVVYQ